MTLIILKLATGFVGGVVNQQLGSDWGVAMLGGGGLGFWLGGFLD